MSELEPNNIQPDGKRTRRSDRMFRRSRAARQRRAQSDKSDFKLISLILQFCVLGAMLMVGAGVYVMRGMSGQASNLGQYVYLAQPWLGPFSRLEVGAVGLFTVIALWVFWRWTRRR